VKSEVIVRSILVPLDGSSGAARILPLVERLAAAACAKLVLVRVVPRVHPAASHDALSLSMALANASSDKREARSSLQAIVETLRRRGLSATYVVASGDPADVIVKHAKQQRVDLIALATQSGSSLDRVLIGSVADQVVQQSQAPVLVLPRRAQSWQCSAPIDVLVPLDGSALAETALPVGRALAGLVGGELHLLRACEQVDASAADGYLARLTAGIRFAGGPVVRTRTIVDARPAEAILRVAHTEAIGLVVMATHGRGGLARAIVGSVASTVLRHADVPVVLIRPHGADHRTSMDELEPAATAQGRRTHVS
jgi:nucleotide-binding universal stress UspA family protein